MTVPIRQPVRRGFTLVEILMVVVILGIASAVIVPQIGTRSDLKARAAARIVVADLIYAQNMAIATQKFHYVKFDTAANRYTVYDDMPVDTDGTGPLGVTGAENVIKHPVNKNNYVVQFGAAGGGRVAELSLDSGGTAFNGIDLDYRPEYTICFDELGTPFVYCPDLQGRNQMINGNVRVRSGTFTLNVKVQRYTGEITIE